MTERRRSQGSLIQAARRKARQFLEIIRTGLVSDLNTALTTDNVDINFNFGGQTAGHIAVEIDSIEKCQILIKNGLELNCKDSDGNTPLHLACIKGYYNVAQVLIKAGADVNTSNNSGLTPLLTSCTLRDAKMVKILLRGGADSNIPDMKGTTPLMLCLLEDYLDLVGVLLENGCQVDRADGELRSPFMVMVELGNLDLASMLLLAGADINHVNKQGRTALFDSAGRGHYQVVKYLIDMGADINICDQNHRSVLIESVEKRQLDIVNLLILSGVGLNIQDYNKKTALHAAVKLAIVEKDQDTLAVHLCQSLLRAECNIDLQDHEGHCPLYLAAKGGHLSLTDELLHRKPRLSLVSNTGNSLVHAGVFSGVMEVVRNLIESGAPVNLKNDKNETALHLAVRRKVKFELTELLVKSGAELDVIESVTHQTALMIAVRGRCHDVLKLLCNHGCDVNIPDREGWSPLNRACQLKDHEAVKTLLMTSRCDVDGTGNNRPLLTAIRSGNYKIVEMLIDTGSDLNVIDDDGHYAMYLAAENNSPSMVKLLLKNGADPDIARSIRSALCCSVYSDPHPHLEISPLYIAVKNDAISILSILLQCYSPVPYHDLGYLHDIIFTTSYAVDANLSQTIEAMLRKIFERVISRPPSLLLLCRNACRKSLGSRPHQKANELPLPNSLIDLILMKDVFKS